MKQFFFYCLAFCLFLSARPAGAQTQTAYSFNLNGIALLGKNRDYYNNGFGISGQYEYGITEKIIGMARGGFIYVPNDFELGILVWLVPVQVGAKYMLNDKFYGQALLGGHRVNAISTFGAGSGMSWGMGVGAGAHLGPIDVGVHLDLLSHGWTHAGLRLGYRVGR